MLISQAPNSAITQELPKRPPILIVGLGNPILGDDGVGWKVAERVAEQCPAGHPLDCLVLDNTRTANTPEVEIDFLSLGGLSLMERMIGYDHAIIIDSLATGEHPCGTVTVCSLTDLPRRALGHLCSAHDTSLLNALDVGRSLGAHLPAEIVVIGIEAEQVYDFSTDLSPVIIEAIPIAVNRIMELIK